MKTHRRIEDRIIVVFSPLISQGFRSRCQDIHQEVDQGLEEPDAAEALPKTSLQEEVEDLPVVPTRTESPGLQGLEVAQAVEAGQRGGGRLRRAPAGGPGPPGEDLAVLRGPGLAMTLLQDVEVEVVEVEEAVVAAEMTGMTQSLTSVWECLA